MNPINLKITGIMLVVLIFLISFVYSINLQPTVIGDSIDLNPEYSNFYNIDSYADFTNNLNTNSKELNYLCSNQKLYNLIEPNFDLRFSSITKNSTDYVQTNVQVVGFDEPENFIIYDSSSVKRSLYFDNMLYKMTNGMVKIYYLEDLSEIVRIKLK